MGSRAVPRSASTTALRYGLTSRGPFAVSTRWRVCSRTTRRRPASVARASRRSVIARRRAGRPVGDVDAGASRDTADEPSKPAETASSRRGQVGRGRTWSLPAPASAPRGRTRRPRRSPGASISMPVARGDQPGGLDDRVVGARLAHDPGRRDGPDEVVDDRRPQDPLLEPDPDRESKVEPHRRALDHELVDDAGRARPGIESLGGLGDQVARLEQAPADTADADEPLVPCQLPGRRPRAVQHDRHLALRGHPDRRLRHEAQRPARVVWHAAEDIDSGAAARRVALSCGHGDAEVPARRLGAAERPRVVGARAADPRADRSADRPDDQGRDDRVVLRVRARVDDGQGRHRRRDAPGRPVLLDRDDPPGARTADRRVAGPCGGTGLGGPGRVRGPVPRLLDDPSGRGDAAGGARRGRCRRRRPVPRRQGRGGDPGAHRDVPEPVHRQHLPADPASGGLPVAGRRVLPAERGGHAGRPRADPGDRPRHARRHARADDLARAPPHDLHGPRRARREHRVQEPDPGRGVGVRRSPPGRPVLPLVRDGRHGRAPERLLPRRRPACPPPRREVHRVGVPAPLRRPVAADDRRGRLVADPDREDRGDRRAAAGAAEAAATPGVVATARGAKVRRELRSAFGRA